MGTQSRYSLQRHHWCGGRGDEDGVALLTSSTVGRWDASPPRRRWQLASRKRASLPGPDLPPHVRHRGSDASSHPRRFICALPNFRSRMLYSQAQCDPRCSPLVLGGGHLRAAGQPQDVAGRARPPPFLLPLGCVHGDARSSSTWRRAR